MSSARPRPLEVLALVVVVVVAAAWWGPAWLSRAQADRPDSAVIRSAAPEPDVLDNLSFETGWDGVTDGGSGPPTGGWPSTLTLDSSTAHHGSTSLRLTYAPSQRYQGSSAWRYWPGGNQDAAYLRFYFRWDGQPITSVLKFVRFKHLIGRGPGDNLGGFFAGNGITFGWDAEENGQVFDIGIFLGPAPRTFENGGFPGGRGRVYAENISGDGEWHALEVYYERNPPDGGLPRASFWFDGTPLVQTLPGWVGNTRVAPERRSSKPIGGMDLLNTLNADNATTGEVRLDWIGVSTTRLGP